MNIDMIKNIKIAISILSITLFSSCVIQSSSGEPISTRKLGVYASYSYDIAWKAVENFITLESIDAYEALPPEEKAKPIYAPYREYREDEIRDNYHYIYFSKFGWIKHNGKRFIEIGSQWWGNYVGFTCIGDKLYSYTLNNGHDRMTFESQLKVTDIGAEIQYEMRENGANGYTSHYYSHGPIIYNREENSLTGRIVVKFYNPSGELADWCDITFSKDRYKLKTSRD